MKKIIMISLFFNFLSCDYQMAPTNLDTQLTKGLESQEEKLLQIEKMFEKYTRDFPSAVNITPKEALKLKNTVFVDVREDYEMNTSMLPGAISKSDFEKNKKEYQDSNIVVYCTIGYRSGIFTEEIAEEGFKAVNLKGGVLLWSHERLDFFKSNIKTNKVHVYGAKWNLAHKDYVSIF